MFHTLQRQLQRAAIIGACAFFVPQAFAQTQPTTIPDAPAQQAVADNQFAGNIAQAQQMAAAMKDEYTHLTTDLPNPNGAIDDDLKRAKEYYDAMIANYDAAAKAWTAGDGASAQKSFAAAQSAMQLKDIWRQRMGEFRVAQANNTPTQQWYADTAANVRPGAMPDFTNLFEKRKAAADAWGNVAEAAVPGVSPQAINDLKEKAFTAEAEAEIALWQFSWANDLEALWLDKTITKDDVKDAMSKMTAQQDALIALRRKRIELDRDVRQAQAGFNQAREDLYKAVGAARDARARAAADAAAAAGK